MEAFLNAKFFKNVSDLYPEFSEFQKKHYKLALLEQAYYVFKNGDISSDSGYNQETLEIANQRKLRALAVAPNAIDHLRLTGLWSGFIGGKGLFGPYFN